VVLLCSITHLNPKLASSSVTFPLLNALVALGLVFAVAICLVFYGMISNIKQPVMDPCLFISEVKDKGKAVPLQAWSGPEGSRKLRLADFMTTA